MVVWQMTRQCLQILRRTSPTVVEAPGGSPSCSQGAPLHRSRLKSSLTRFAVLACAALLTTALPHGANAQSCGTDYTIQAGDSLSGIARRVYGSSSKWTLIFYANQDRLGDGVSLMVPGTSVRIPCVEASEELPARATVRAQPVEAQQPSVVRSRTVRSLKFLTADDYKPFTDRSLQNGGMITDLMNAAMAGLNAELKEDVQVSISWVNDWSAHLQPLLSSRAFDMGFPWIRPPCEQYRELNASGQFRCRRYFFSDPLFEIPTMFFVRPDSSFTYASDSDVVGRSICIPAGYYIFHLDSNGRNWLRDGKVTLIRARSVDECFQLVDAGSVEMVALNEFTGRGALAGLGWSNRIRMIERPLAITTLHVIVAKTHPQARSLLYYVNEGLRRLRAQGEYDAIVENHLITYWDTIAEQEAEAAAAAEAIASETPAEPEAPSGARTPAATETDSGNATTGAPRRTQLAAED